MKLIGWDPRFVPKEFPMENNFSYIPEGFTPAIPNGFVRSSTEAEFRNKMIIRKMVHAVETKSHFIMTSGRRYSFSKMQKDAAFIIKRKLDHPDLTLTEITWVDQMVDAIYNKHTNCRPTHYYSLEEWKTLTETFN